MPGILSVEAGKYFAKGFADFVHEPVRPAVLIAKLNACCSIDRVGIAFFGGKVMIQMFGIIAPTAPRGQQIATMSMRNETGIYDDFRVTATDPRVNMRSLKNRLVIPGQKENQRIARSASP
jgi:hypothetical protein